MIIKKQLTQLAAIVLLTGISTLTVANAKDTQTTKTQAPTITAEEAKISFWDRPYLEKAYINTSPNKGSDGIPVGKLGVGPLDINNGNKDMIVKFAKELAAQKHGKIDSLLISHQSELVFESYYLRGRLDSPHMQASSTKSYLSMAVGRAIKLGYLTMDDLHKPLVSFLKDLDLSKTVDGADKITLHNALNMGSGMRITRDQLKAFKENPEQLKGQGQVQTFLENSPAINKQSQVFKYSNTDPRLVMQVLDTVVPGNAKDFIKTELLGKMGITNYDWRTDDSGLPTGPYGSKMTSRDMVKWGTLIMNKGQYNGEQLIDKTFVKQATAKIVSVNPEDIFFSDKNITNPGYGYYFWQADMTVGGKTYHTVSAQGGGGQYIVMIDKLDLMVVFTAHERDDKTMQMTVNKVLPAFVD